jgi:hypothetical protein
MSVQEFTERLGVTRALVYTMLGRTWSILSGPFSLIFIARFLSKDEQGFYFTFWSVVGLWVFFDLGLTSIIVQFASHERALLRFVDGGMRGDERARQRLASLFRVACRWYGGAGALIIALVLPAGLIFFTHYRPPHVPVNWLGPWILVVLFTALNVTVGPFASILEGCGMLQDVALMRLLQSITASVFLWVALFSGASLYAAAVLSGTTALFGACWIVLRHHRLFRDLATVASHGHRIRWRREIWPFQWRFAISWMTAYFMFQVFNPILFAAQGPRAAGQMGMSLMITTAIWLVAQAWVNTRAVDFGAFVAARTFDVLDRVFRQVFVQSSALALLLSAAVMAGVGVLRQIGHPLAERLLPPLPLSILIVATLLNHWLSAEATYLRAFKREPFVMIYLPIGVITALGSLIAAPRFGATGMVSVLALAMGIVGVGVGTPVFLARRREWRAEVVSGRGDAEEAR